MCGIELSIETGSDGWGIYFQMMLPCTGGLNILLVMWSEM